MSDPVQPGGNPKSRSKPNTRSSSLRQLNLASVGKAIIAGVRSKEASTDETKVAKKARRSSVTPQPVSAPRASIGGESRPLAQPSKRDSVTPETKIVTRRRAAQQSTRSGTDSEAMKSSDANVTPTAANPRGGTSLRPKTVGAASSALPKLRPKAAAVVEQRKAPSPAPAKAGSRRRLSTSSSDEGGKEQRKPEPSPLAVAEKSTRPISPLPHRATLKSSSAVNATPPATPSPSSKLKPPSPPLQRNGSPTRPTKLMKTTNNATSKNMQRPPPQTLSSSSASPITPKGPSALKSALTRSAQERSKAATTPLKDSPLTPSRDDSPSPLARRHRKVPKSTSSSSFSSSNVTDMSPISEGDSDSDEEDAVQALLAPTENLALATPAMPRISRVRRRGLHPETPSRPREKQPTLSLSHLAPPPNRHTPNLRPPKASPANSSSKDPLRMSILSWEHASLQASQQLGHGELDKMLYDVAAPFSGPTSPTMSHIEIPPSPCLSAIDSPLGFQGSISQVLLPEVTPSPAAHLNAAARYNISAEASADSAATYLRLQLAAAEELSNERMHRMMAMEEEIHNLKQAHQQQMEEMAAHVAFVEKQAEQTAHLASLEEEVRVTKVKAEQAVRDALAQKDQEAKAQKTYALKAQRRKMDAVYSSVLAGTAWVTVQDACQAEMETVAEERQVLSMLLAELESMALSL